MIALIIYTIGIFITPIILKRCFKLPTDEECAPLDRDTIVMCLSITWPLSSLIWIIYKISFCIIWIYNKV